MDETTPAFTPVALNEAEENMLRTLVARLRETNPAAFTELLFQSTLNRVPTDSITAFRHCDSDDIPDAILVLFTGYGPTQWAEKSVLDLKRQTEAAEGEAAQPTDEENEG